MRLRISSIISDCLGAHDHKQGARPTCTKSNKSPPTSNFPLILIGSSSVWTTIILLAQPAFEFSSTSEIKCSFSLSCLLCAHVEISTGILWVCIASSMKTWSKRISYWVPTQCLAFGSFASCLINTFISRAFVAKIAAPHHLPLRKLQETKDRNAFIMILMQYCYVCVVHTSHRESLLAERRGAKLGYYHNMSSVVCDASVLWQNGWS